MGVETIARFKPGVNEREISRIVELANVTVDFAGAQARKTEELKACYCSNADDCPYREED